MFMVPQQYEKDKEYEKAAVAYGRCKDGFEKSVEMYNEAAKQYEKKAEDYCQKMLAEKYPDSECGINFNLGSDTIFRVEKYFGCF